MGIGSIIGGVASVAGSILGSKSQKKAANTAAQAATDNTAANNAIAREIYAQNKATLSPFVNSGTQASGAINALLGLGGPAPVVGNSPAPASYGGGNSIMGAPNALMGYKTQPSYWDSDTGYYEGFGPTGAMQTAVTTQAAPQTAQQQYQNAFDNYRNSTGYNFRVNEGNRALSAGASAGGFRGSGAADKARIQYGQNIASGESGNYLNALMGQQGVGLSAAGAQAGVSTNFVNQTTANNNNQASALANAAIAKGNATGNMWQGIAGGIGGLFGSSFR